MRGKPVYLSGGGAYYGGTLGIGVSTMSLRCVLMPAVATLLCYVVPLLPAQTEAVISTGSASTVVGDIFDIPVNVSLVTDLHNFQFDLSFDPTLLQLLNVTEGSFLPSAGTTHFFGGFIDNTFGTVTLVMDSLSGMIPGASGSGTLANLNFQGVGSGRSALTLSGVYLQNSSHTNIPFTISNGSVTVTAVPEPRAWTWITPLLALLCLYRRGSRPREVPH
jgi:hypothetical protein